MMASNQQQQHFGIPLPVTADRNSVFPEITRNFRATLRAAKPILNDEKHPFITACLHACIFPTDRLSLQLVWSQFEQLSVGNRIEILSALRKSAL
jgi:hypothetical protein